MPRYLMLLEYDGTDFCGWQVQPNGKSIQETIESAFRTIFRSEVAVTGSGRTDTGVHARGQVAHFDLSDATDAHRLQNSLNGILPPAIAIRKIEQTHDTFHARFDARNRTYHYRVSTVPAALERHTRVLLRPPPDFALMNRAAESLPGENDFDAFCKTQSATKNRACKVNHALWVRESRPEEWRFEIKADRFLHGMVRAIVGTLLEIGRGKRPAHDIARILASRDRREAGPAAPAHGLILHEVEY